MLVFIIVFAVALWLYFSLRDALDRSDDDAVHGEDPFGGQR